MMSVAACSLHCSAHEAPCILSTKPCNHVCKHCTRRPVKARPMLGKGLQPARCNCKAVSSYVHTVTKRVRKKFNTHHLRHMAAVACRLCDPWDLMSSRSSQSMPTGCRHSYWPTCVSLVYKTLLKSLRSALIPWPWFACHLCMPAG